MARDTENRNMAAADDWGGVKVGDDWGGVAVAEKDDWGGVPVESAAAPAAPAAPAPNLGPDDWPPERIAAHNREAERIRGLAPGSLDAKDDFWAVYEGLSAATSPGAVARMDGGMGEAYDFLTTGTDNRALVHLPKPQGDTVAAGVGRGAANLVEGLTTPENFALMAALGGAPRVIQKIAAGVFAADMGAHLPSQIERIRGAKGPGETAQASTEAAGTALMAFLAGSHAFGRSSLPVDVAERRAMFSEAEQKALEHVGPNTAAEIRRMSEAAIASGEAQAGEMPSQTTPRSEVKENPVLGQIAGLWRQIQETPPGEAKDALMAQMRALDAKLEGGQEIPATPSVETPKGQEIPAPPPEPPPVIDARAAAPAAEIAPEPPPAPASAQQPASAAVVETPLDPAVVEAPEGSTAHSTVTSGTRAAKVTEYPDKIVIGDIFTSDAKGPGSAKAIFDHVAAKGKPIEVTVGRRSGDSDAATLAKVYERYGFKPVGEPGERGIPNKMRWDPPVTESAPPISGESPNSGASVPTVEDVIQQAMAEHGTMDEAGTAIQVRIEDPATPPEVRTVLENSLKRMNAIAEREYRREQAADLEASNKAGKYELVSEVKRLGGLPTLNGKGGEATGELGRIIEAKKGAFLSLFRKGAKSLDEIRESLNEVGFDFETGYDVLTALEDSLVNDRVYYGEKDLPMGPGKMTIGELPPQRTTGLKKSVVADERIQRGLDDLPPAERQGEEARVDAAEARVDADATLGPSLVSRIVDQGEHAISLDDAAVLLVERTRLMNEREMWQERMGDAGVTKPGEVEAQLQAIENQMHRLDQAQRASGSSWGRVGHLYKRMMRADFSLEGMLRRERASKGAPLTPDEIAKVQKEADAIFQANAEADIAANTERLAEEGAEIQRVHEAAAKAESGEPAPKVRFDRRVLEIAENIVKKWESTLADDRKALRQAMGYTNVGANPAGIAALARIIRAKIGRFGVDLGKITVDLITEFGEDVRPLISKAWVKANQLINREVKDSKVKKVVKDGTEKANGNKPVATPDEVKARAKAEATAGGELSHDLVFKYVRSLIQAGAKEADVMKLAHEGLKEFFPSITDRGVNRAYVEYGRKYFPSRDQLKVTERHLRQVVKIEEDIARLEKDKLRPEKQGYQRDKADMQIRDLQRKRNDLLKSTDIPVDPGKMASIDEAKQTRLKNAIEEMDRQIQTESKVPRAPGAPDSPAVERLKMELKAMRDLWEEIDARKNPPPTPEQLQIDALGKIRQRLDDVLSGAVEPVKRGDFTPLTQAAADIQAEILAMRELAAQLRREARPGKPADAAQVKGLEKAIERYREKVEKGDFSTKGKAHGPDTARVAALKEVLASRRSMYEIARRANKPVRTAEERYNDARVKSAQRQIEEIDKRMIRGDYGPRPPKVMPKIRAATEKALHELDEKKRAFLEGQHKWELERRSAFKKAVDATAETYHTMRAVMTGGEFSGVLRQGKFSVLSRPITTAKTLPSMFKAFKSKLGEDAVIREISKRDNAPLYKSAGLEIPDPNNFTKAQLEGNYRSRWANKIPFIAGSGRAYTAFLARLRADVFDQLIDKAVRREGVVNPETAKALATHVNESTGAGGLGVKGKAATTFLNTVLFSPKFLASRFQMMTGHSMWGGTKASRMIIAGEYAKILGSAALFYSLANMAGAKIGSDPKSSDFGKIIIGKTRWDPMAGILQLTVLLSRMKTGKRTNAKGVTYSLTNAPPKQADMKDVLFDFSRSKLAPLPGAFVDSVLREDFKHRPVTLRSELQNLALPMTWGDIYDAMREQGMPKGTALSILATFGESVNTYTDDGPKRRHAGQ